MSLSRSTVAWALLLSWATVSAVGGVVRPGMVLEFALIGVAGTAAFAVFGAARPTLFSAVVGLTCFAAPLLNTWPFRVYDSAWTGAPRTAWALASPASLLVILCVAAGREARPRIPRLVIAGALLLAVGAVAGAAVAVDKSDAFANGWVTFIIPIAFGVAVATATRSAADGWRWLTIALAAAIVPIGIAIAAYTVDFGIPRSPTSLVFAKVALFRPHLLQDETFGNVLHLADFALLVMPAALVAAVARKRRLTQLVGAGVALGAILVLVLIVSRSALAVGGAAALGTAVALFCSGFRRPAAVPAAALAVLLAVSLTPAVRRSFAGLLPRTGPPPVVAPTGKTKTPAPAPTEQSETFRAHAATHSVQIFRHHAPFGVGTGEYARYDPIRTAAHSLPLQILVEDGVLGLLGILLVALYVGWAAVRLLHRPRTRTDDEQRLRIACVASALAFLVHGVIAGAALTLGAASVWSLLLWLQIGILARLDVEESRAS